MRTGTSGPRSIGRTAKHRIRSKGAFERRGHDGGSASHSFLRSRCSSAQSRIKPSLRDARDRRRRASFPSWPAFVRPMPPPIATHHRHPLHLRQRASGDPLSQPPPPCGPHFNRWICARPMAPSRSRSISPPIGLIVFRPIECAGRSRCKPTTPPLGSGSPRPRWRWCGGIVVGQLLVVDELFP